MSLPHPYNVSGESAGIETPPRRRQTNQPPNLLTTSLGNARNTGLGFGGVVQTPVSSTTLSSPFSAYPQSPHSQAPRGNMRGASPMASRSASGFTGHYNPQQWGTVNSVSPNSMSMAGEPRQTCQSARTVHLAAHCRPVGPDGKPEPYLVRAQLMKTDAEPVATPPPPYSPRRDLEAQDSPRCTSDIISPANTTSPDTEHSHHGTPVSAATTLSPELVSRFSGGRSPLIPQHTSPNESPNALSMPSFPPPPGQRIRAGSKSHADRLLSSLTLRGKPSKVPLATDAIDTLQDRTTQLLAQASPADYNDPTVHPPATRRAASTGGIGLARDSSRSGSHSPSPITWEPNMPLPGPPPGPPPSARSQSLNRPVESPSSGLAPTLPFRSRRPLGTRSNLETVPPTPADWNEEDGINDQDPSRDRSHVPSPLHIDTGSILRRRRSGAEHPITAGGSVHPRRDSSAGGLFRSPAVRNRSAMGIRERRSESRNGKGRAVGYSAVEPSSSVAPWTDGFQEDVRPANLVLSASEMNASKQRMTAKSTPNSGKSMRSLEGALKSPEILKSSRKALDSFESTMPQPGSSGSQHFSAKLTSIPSSSPGRETLDRYSSAVASPSLPLKTISVPPSSRLSNASKVLSLVVPPGSEHRPVSHLLNLPISDDSLQVLPLTPSTKAAQEPLDDLLGPESPKLFAGRAIERHRIFAEREAAAATNSERLELFVQCKTPSCETSIKRKSILPHAVLRKHVS